MDIKVGRNNRLRLTANDFESLKNDFILRESFSLSPSIRINVEVIVDRSGALSNLTSGDSSLIFFISESDFNLLAMREHKKSGLSVDNYTIQVDLWNEDTRARRESHI